LTFVENQEQINQMKEALYELKEKKFKEDKELTKLQDQYSMCNQQQVEIVTIQ
jgi:hypothetical protein